MRCSAKPGKLRHPCQPGLAQLYDRDKSSPVSLQNRLCTSKALRSCTHAGQHQLLQTTLSTSLSSEVLNQAW